MPQFPPLRKESVYFKHIFKHFPAAFDRKFFLIWTIISFLSMPVFSQETENKEKPTYDSDHPERKVTTYLDVHHAVKNINPLKDQVKLDIIRLNRAVSNFKGKIEGADNDYNLIRENYKKGIDLYYRREYLESSFVLKDTRKMSQNLYKKFTEHFQVQVGELLNSCSESMVNNDLKSIDNQVSFDELRQNQYRLRIAYNQVYMADQMTRDNRYDAALDHLRLAKLYAIHVLKNMETDSAKKEAMDKEYAADIIDAMGGLVGSVQTDNPS